MQGREPFDGFTGIGHGPAIGKHPGVGLEPALHHARPQLQAAVEAALAKQVVDGQGPRKAAGSQGQPVRDRMDEAGYRIDLATALPANPAGR